MQQSDDNSLQHMNRRNRRKISEKASKSGLRRVCVAPMMEWTDRHCRFFHRLLTRRALLYTEMVTTGAVLHGDRAAAARFRSGRAAGRAAARRLRSRGARAMRAHRRGVRLSRDQSQRRLPVGPRAGGPLRRLPDGGAGAGRRLRRRDEGRGRDPGHGEVPHRHRRAGSGDGAARRFAAMVEAAGADALIVHARKAWLKGLSPRENRDIPPLDYDLVYRLKAAHPNLPVIINGGIPSIEAAREHLATRRRRDDGPRRLSGAVAAAAGRSDAVRRGRAVRVGQGRGACADPLHRARAVARRAAAFHHPPCARPVPWRARRARVPPASGDRGGQARRMRAGVGRRAGPGGGQARANWRKPPRPDASLRFFRRIRCCWGCRSASLPCWPRPSWSAASPPAFSPACSASAAARSSCRCCTRCFASSACPRRCGCSCASAPRWRSSFRPPSART